MSAEIWTHTATGLVVNLLDPRPEQIRLADIARHLSRIPRFNGATFGAGSFSVARHGILVQELLGPDIAPRLRLAALLADAHKAYTGEITTPVRMRLDRTSNQSFSAHWYDMVESLQRAIHLAFGLPETNSQAWTGAIRLAGEQALRLEKRRFLEPIASASLPPPPLPETAPGLDTYAAELDEDEFVRTAIGLMRACHGLPETGQCR